MEHISHFLASSKKELTCALIPMEQRIDLNAQIFTLVSTCVFIASQVFIYLLQHLINEADAPKAQRERQIVAVGAVMCFAVAALCTELTGQDGRIVCPLKACPLDFEAYVVGMSAFTMGAEVAVLVATALLRLVCVPKRMTVTVLAVAAVSVKMTALFY